jgi:hypothetical protein
MPAAPPWPLGGEPHGSWADSWPERTVGSRQGRPGHGATQRVDASPRCFRVPNHRCCKYLVRLFKPTAPPGFTYSAVHPPPNDIDASAGLSVRLDVDDPAMPGEVAGGKASAS